MPDTMERVSSSSPVRADFSTLEKPADPGPPESGFWAGGVDGVSVVPDLGGLRGGLGFFPVDFGFFFPIRSRRVFAARTGRVLTDTF